MSIDNSDLTHFHTLESIKVTFGRNTRRSSTVYSNGSFINLSLDKHSIRDNTYIRTKAEKLNLFKIFRLSHSFSQLIGAEGRLVDYFTALSVKLGCNLPSVSTLYTVWNRKLFSLSRVKIILTVSISGENNSVTVFTVESDFFFYLIDYGYCLFRAESSVDKVE